MGKKVDTLTVEVLKAGVKVFDKQYPALKGLIRKDGNKEALVQSYEQLLDPRGPLYTMGTD